MTRAQSEWVFQIAVTRFLHHALPPGAYSTSIDHARAMSKAAGAARKRRGVKPGIPDVLIVHQGVTLWIELKAGSGLSDHQRHTRDVLRDNGHHWALASSLEDVQAACEAAGIPLRAVIQAAPAAPRKRVTRPTKVGPRYAVGKRTAGRLRAAGVFV